MVVLSFFLFFFCEVGKFNSPKNCYFYIYHNVESISGNKRHWMIVDRHAECVDVTWTWIKKLKKITHTHTSHYITLHHITSHYITHITLHHIHHITSHYVTHTLHHITSHYITLHHITSHYITLHHITSHYITLHHITSHYITLHHITSHYITHTHHITSHYITLHHTHTFLPVFFFFTKQKNLVYLCQWIGIWNNLGNFCKMASIFFFTFFIIHPSLLKKKGVFEHNTHR